MILLGMTLFSGGYDSVLGGYDSIGYYSVFRRV